MIYVITFFIIIGICIFFFLNIQYKRTNQYKNSFIYSTGFCNKKTNGKGYANLGSTYAKFAFGAYESVGIDGLNLALKSESLEMDYAVLKEYKGCLSTGAIVFIPVSPCLMLFDDVRSNQSISSRLINRRNNPGFSFITVLKNQLPLYNPLKVKYLVKDSQFSFQDIYDTAPTYVDDETAKKKLDSLVNVWLKLFNLVDLKSVNFSEKNMKIIENNKNYLVRIVRLCIDNGLTPVVVTTPFSEYLNSRFSTEFKQEVMYKVVDEIVREYDVKFFDYEKDDYFAKRPQLFVDGGFCMNKRGSKMFLKRVFGDLERISLSKQNQ